MTVPSLDEGDEITDEWVDAVAADVNALQTFANWTPTLDQGATLNIAKTVANARYVKLGKLVICQFQLNITGTGTAGEPAFARDR
jgi:hypothetical protein